MKKIILIAAMAVMSLVASAQEVKFACVSFEEVFVLMPDMEEVELILDENRKVHSEELMGIYQEYQTKYQAYVQNAQSWTPAVREGRERELVDLQNRYEQNQQIFQQELMALENEKKTPLLAKLRETINQIAKEKGVAAVFDKVDFIYFDADQLIDITPDVRAALGIPEDRTIEAYQAEQMAKAQAAQAQAAQMQ